MKKFLIALLITLLVAALGAGLYFGVTLFLEDEQPPQTASSDVPGQPQSSPPAELNVKKKVKDYAEMLDALDYETQENRDTVGWVKIEGTDINNSVLQSYDNAYYLRRNERRQYDVYGCYFADYECSIGSREELSRNTIIYGHNELTDDPDGRRFAQLYRFLDPEFAAATPCVEFCTAKDPMEWQIFAVFYTDVGFNYIAVNVTDEELTSIIETARLKSIYDYGVSVTAQDKILTLSTCTSKFGDSDHRFVVMAKLLEEDAEIPETAALTDRPENR